MSEGERTGAAGAAASSTHGLALRLDHTFPLRSRQAIEPRPGQALALLTLGIRYLSYYVDSRLNNRRPIMDYMTTISAQRMYGCPIGGIGGGTIGRGFKGEFCRFHLYPGVVEYMTVPECQFIVNIRNAENDTIFQSVLSTYQKPKKAPESWQWNVNGADCHYRALYPRAWTTYDLSKYGVKLVCRQVTPVIPHNYKDSSLPCAVFVWTATNVCDEHRAVSITFTWKEITNKKRKHGQHPATNLELERYSEDHTSGISIEQKINGTPCTFTIAKRKRAHESIHENYCMFNTAKRSSYVWECLERSGRLEPEPEKANVPPPGKDPDAKDKEKPRFSKSYKYSSETDVYRLKVEGGKEGLERPKSCSGRVQSDIGPAGGDGVGLSSSVSLDPGRTDMMEFCLSWDMPNVQFKKNSKVHKRYYTRYFGSDGLAGAGIAAYALINYNRWEEEMDAFQDPILDNSNIPDWLKSALMNELYYIADGGTLWFDAHDDFPESDPRHTYGVFGYLEGHEYRMYTSYDVHFYASFALAQLWPNLQVVIQYMYRDAIHHESDGTIKALYDGKNIRRKVNVSVPHDLGDPDEEPFTHINAYNIHDVSEWRDLNSKFILQVFRDYKILKSLNCDSAQEQRYHCLDYIDDVQAGTEDDLYERSTGQVPEKVQRVRIESPKKVMTNGAVPDSQNNWCEGNILDLLYSKDSTEQTSAPQNSRAEESERERGARAAAWPADRYAADMYPSCVALVRKMRAWDADGDGLIENTGSPDQTFDAWVMTGPSAYCGGLWLTALFFMKNLAQILKKPEDEKEFDELLQKAIVSYDTKLWNGTHYKFDSLPKNSRVVMSAQLCGQWYLRAAGFSHELLPKDKVLSALQTIFDNNVLKFCNGKMGAVNGFITEKGNQPGRVDHSALQSEEMWTGVTYGVAALMIHEGMPEQAFHTAGELYKTMSEGMGLSFETPEALTEIGNHRSIGYMRPLSIWAMYHALQMNPEIMNKER